MVRAAPVIRLLMNLRADLRLTICDGAMSTNATSSFSCNCASTERTIFVYVELLGPMTIRAVGTEASVLSLINHQNFLHHVLKDIYHASPDSKIKVPTWLIVPAVVLSKTF